MLARDNLGMFCLLLVMENIAFNLMIILECFSNRLGMECASASIPPDALPLQVDVVGTNLPPHAQEDVEADQEQIIESLKDSHEEEEHILPPAHGDSDSSTVDPDVPEGSGEVDPKGQMPGQLPAAATQVEEVRSYAQCKEQAKESICQLLEQEVVIHKHNQSVKWEVIQESVTEIEDEVLSLGLKDTSVLNLPRGEATGKLF